MFLPNRFCYFETCSAKGLTHNICISIMVRNTDLCLLAPIYLGKMKIRLLKYNRTMTIRIPSLNLSLWFPPICINQRACFHSDFFFFIILCHQACSNAAFCGFYMQSTHSCNILFIPFQGQGGLKRSTMKQSLHAFSSNRLQIVLDCNLGRNIL